MRWNDMDYGPALAATYSIDKKQKVGGMLSILLQSGHTVTFDREKGSYFNAWEGRPYFNPHRWGFIHGVAVPEGTQATDLALVWTASPKGQTMSALRWALRLRQKRVIAHCRWRRRYSTMCLA